MWPIQFTAAYLLHFLREAQIQIKPKNASCNITSGWSFSRSLSLSCDLVLFLFDRFQTFREELKDIDLPHQGEFCVSSLSTEYSANDELFRFLLKPSDFFFFNVIMCM